MDKLIIEGGKKLKGEVLISGAKNSALPLLSATILARGKSKIKNVPELADIGTMKKILTHMGAVVIRDGETVSVDTSRIASFEAPYELVKTMRASVLVLGPLVARYGTARVSLPGGCAIGARPINLHLKALEAMGATIKLEHGYVEAKSTRLKGAKIYFDISTVTGTENIMMAATLAKDITVLENAAKEPEVVELAQALNKMGAHIEGAGTDIITIYGVDSLRPLNYSVMSDRIETGTFMIAAAITRGDIVLKHAHLNHLEALVSKLKDAGVKIIQEGDSVRVKGTGTIKSVDITTSPYPAFPTDMQAQFMALMAIAEGSSVISETIFENRFMHVSELIRMGADIKIDGHTAVIKGRKKLSGAPLMATDLRASASLVLAGLCAEGTTEISRIYHLDRGYEKMDEKLKKLGADIKRIKG